MLKPDDIVVMDNLVSQKSAAMRPAINAAGARLWFLPPYSLDPNPIEQAFLKIKHWIRNAQKRTIDDTWQHIAGPSKQSNPDECANDLKMQGMVPAKGETL